MTASGKRDVRSLTEDSPLPRDGTDGDLVYFIAKPRRSAPLFVTGRSKGYPGGMVRHHRIAFFWSLIRKGGTPDVLKYRPSGFGPHH
jgi:hypothetical protein